MSIRDRLTKEKLIQIGFKEIDENIFTYEDYVSLKLEDGNWEDVSFDLFIRGTYITWVDTEYKLRKIFDACDLW